VTAINNAGPCRQCGKRYRGNRDSKFCGNKCRGLSKRTRQFYEKCERCGKPTGRCNKYCGRACYEASQRTGYGSRGRTMAPCVVCSKPAWAPPSRARRQRITCSVECAEKLGHHAKGKGRTCSYPDCGIVGTRRAPVRRGLCSKHFQQMASITPEFQKKSAVCAGCGETFRSVQTRKYCSPECYLKNAGTPQLTRLVIERGGVLGSFDVTCMHCSRVRRVSHSDAKRRKFCNRACTRAWFASRYDRWFASPGVLGIPMSFDEFLSKEKLPCLVAGCAWEGDSLSLHMNYAHGVRASELKALAGFNRGTGVIGSELVRRFAENAWSPEEASEARARRARPLTESTGSTKRPEWHEHAKRSWAILRQQAFDEGREAARSGAAIEACPHGVSTSPRTQSARKEWIRGWQSAQTASETA